MTVSASLPRRVFASSAFGSRVTDAVCRAVVRSARPSRESARGRVPVGHVDLAYRLPGAHRDVDRLVAGATGPQSARDEVAVCAPCRVTAFEVREQVVCARSYARDGVGGLWRRLRGRDVNGEIDAAVRRAY